MARSCTVCAHVDRDIIDGALVASSTSNRRIAAQYALSENAVRRHARRHLPASLTVAAGAAEAAKADDLLDRLATLDAFVDDVLVAAAADGAHGMVLRAVREARAGVELRARLGGELADGNALTVILTAPRPDRSQPQRVVQLAEVRQ
jgi:hypothetical protein